LSDDTIANGDTGQQIAWAQAMLAVQIQTWWNAPVDAAALRRAAEIANRCGRAELAGAIEVAWVVSDVLNGDLFPLRALVERSAHLPMVHVFAMSILFTYQDAHAQLAEAEVSAQRLYAVGFDRNDPLHVAHRAILAANRGDYRACRALADEATQGFTHGGFHTDATPSIALVFCYADSGDIADLDWADEHRPIFSVLINDDSAAFGVACRLLHNNQPAQATETLLAQIPRSMMAATTAMLQFVLAPCLLAQQRLNEAGSSPINTLNCRSASIIDAASWLPSCVAPTLPGSITGTRVQRR
jgi:hypothetical protein